MTYDNCIKGLTPEKLAIATSYLKGLVDGCGIVATNDKENKPGDKRQKETSKEARR